MILLILTAVGGLLGGAVLWRGAAASLPGSLQQRLAAWYVSQGLQMGDAWLFEQRGEHRYIVRHLDDGANVDWSQVGHISAGGSSVRCGISYNHEAVEESDLVDVTDIDGEPTDTVRAPEDPQPVSAEESDPLEVGDA
jgi:hypothetical protein